LRHGICVAKMLDKTSSIICAFGLASAVPRSPYRHLELCGIALNYTIPPGKKHAVEPDIPGEQNAAVFGSFSTCVLLSFLVD
ncbi:MAG: hypothetical protein WAT15_02655, partial [Gemmiger qucibialis]